MNYRNFAALLWQDVEKSDFDAERNEILEHLNSNLNSAGAFAVLDGVAKSGLAPSNEFLKFIDDAFGLEIGKTTPDISDEIKAKISERISAKESKEYATADKLRDEILEQGIELLDSADGVKWQYKD